MCRVRRLFGWFALVWVLCWASAAAAQSFPAPLQFVQYGTSSPFYASAQAVCEARIPVITDPQYEARNIRADGGNIGGCTSDYYRVSNGQLYVANNYVSLIFSTRVSCPANSTGTSTCTCNTGFTLGGDGASCVPPNACTGLTGTSYGPFNVAVTQGANRPTMACVSGCSVQVTPSDIGVIVGDGSGRFWATGLTGTYSAATCTGTTDPVGDTEANGQPVPNPPPPGMCPGTVNGQAVNVPCAVSESSNSAASGSSTTEGPSPEGAVPGTSSTGSSTKCEGGQCTTTNTTTTNNSNGTTTTTVSSSKTTQEDFCSKNPKALVCEGTGKPKDPQASQFYSKKDKTVASVLGGAKDTLMASPVGSAVGGFFSVSGGGSCPDTSWHIPFLNADVQASVWCGSLAASVFAIIRAVLLVVAGFMAFRIAIDN